MPYRLLLAFLVLPLLLAACSSSDDPPPPPEPEPTSPEQASPTDEPADEEIAAQLGMADQPPVAGSATDPNHAPPRQDEEPSNHTTPEPAPAPDPRTPPEVDLDQPAYNSDDGYILRNGAALHAGPAPDWGVRARLQPGQSVELIGRLPSSLGGNTDGWLRLTTDNGLTGWVDFGGLLPPTPIFDALPTVPAVADEFVTARFLKPATVHAGPRTEHLAVGKLQPTDERVLHGRTPDFAWFQVEGGWVAYDASDPAFELVSPDWLGAVDPTEVPVAAFGLWIFATDEHDNQPSYAFLSDRPRQFAWTPDGSAVVYTTRARDGEPAELRVYDLNTGESRLLLTHGREFALSPDGSAVAVQASAPTDGLTGEARQIAEDAWELSRQPIEIWIVTLDGRATRAGTMAAPCDAPNQQPSWTFDFYVPLFSGVWYPTSDALYVEDRCAAVRSVKVLSFSAPERTIVVPVGMSAPAWTDRGDLIYLEGSELRRDRADGTAHPFPNRIFANGFIVRSETITVPYDGQVSTFDGDGHLLRLIELDEQGHVISEHDFPPPPVVGPTVGRDFSFTDFSTDILMDGLPEGEPPLDRSLVFFSRHSDPFAWPPNGLPSAPVFALAEEEGTIVWFARTVAKYDFNVAWSPDGGNLAFGLPNTCK